jgi:hypothetical protein
MIFPMKKQKNTVLAQARISPSSATKLRQIAKNNGRTYAGQIRYLLETFVSDNTK